MVLKSKVICAFAQHSTSLFSLYDSPVSASMRHHSSSVSASSSVKRASSKSPKPPESNKYTASDFERSPTLLGKRRSSERSSLNSEGGQARARADRGDGGDNGLSRSPQGHQEVNRGVPETGQGSASDSETRGDPEGELDPPDHAKRGRAFRIASRNGGRECCER